MNHQQTAKLTIKQKFLAFQQLSIRGRLIISFSIVLLLLITMSMVTYSKMNAIAYNDKEIQRVSLPIIIEATNMNNDMLQINKQLNEMVESTMPITLKRLQGDIEGTMSSLEASRLELEPLIKELQNEELTAHYSELLTQWDKYKEHVTAAMNESIDGKTNVAKDEAFKGNAYFDRSNQSLLSIIDNAKERINAGVSDSVRLSEQGMAWIFTISISSIIFTVALVYVTLIMITRPISAISQRVDKVAMGDFTVEPLEVKTKDELGKLTRNFNLMTQTLRQVIKEVVESAANVTYTAEQLSYRAEETKAGVSQVAVSAEHVSSETNDQLKGISETDLHMNEIVRDIQEVDENVQTVTSLSEVANQKAQAGQQDMDRIIGQMNEIESRVKESVHEINRLAQKTKEVDRIVVMISNLSSQTNLLALNAAIEAARAGEAGRGFAVVADEVRKLATQSTKATEEIRGIMKEIQYDTKETMAAMELTNTSTEQGRVIITHAGNSFGRIVESTASVNEEMKQVLLHIERVTERTRTILKTVKQIEAVAKQNSFSAETVASISEESSAAMEEVSESLMKLFELSEGLNGKVKRFTIE